MCSYFCQFTSQKKIYKVGSILKSEQDETENLSIPNDLLSQVDDQMKLLQDSWSEMLILDHMHHRMHNNLPDETQLPNGQVISIMAVVVRMRMSIVVLFVRIGIIVPTEQKMWYVEVAKKVVFDLMMDDLFGASRAL